MGQRVALAAPLPACDTRRNTKMQVCGGRHAGCKHRHGGHAEPRPTCYSGRPWTLWARQPHEACRDASLRRQTRRMQAPPRRACRTKTDVLFRKTLDPLGKATPRMHAEMQAPLRRACRRPTHHPQTPSNPHRGEASSGMCAESREPFRRKPSEPIGRHHLSFFGV